MINAYGYIFGELGYNIHGRKFFQALNRITPVCMVPLDPPSGGSHPIETEFVETMIPRQKTIRLSDPAICLNYGNQLHKFNGSFLIGYTVFEYTKLAPDWLNLLHQMDAVWIPSSWGKHILIDNGLPEKNLGIVPEGIDPAVYFPQKAKTNNGRDKFTFLSIGKWEPRKGQIELLRAWSEVFADCNDVEMYVLWENPFLENFSVQNEIRKLGGRNAAAIKAIPKLPTYHHMARLYNMADCFVLPTRAEGWGLPVIEAMACGLPVITTRYSAMTDYANDENAYLIDVKSYTDVYDPIFFPHRGQAGVWAEIDHEHLKALLRHVYTHRDEAREKGKLAGKQMHDRWTWDMAAQKAAAFLRKSGIAL